MSDRQYCVYIMTNAHRTVPYTGVTKELRRQVLEYRAGKWSGFTKKYNIPKLVYVERGDDINLAIAREMQIKAGSRASIWVGRICLRSIWARSVIAGRRLSWKQEIASVAKDTPSQ